MEFYQAGPPENTAHEVRVYSTEKYYGLKNKASTALALLRPPCPSDPPDKIGHREKSNYYFSWGFDLSCPSKTQNLFTL